MSLHKPTVFTGVATALITPFCDGEIDYPAIDRLIEMQITSGISAILVAGTTGEGSTLTVREHHQLVKFAKERIAGRVPLLAGCGSNSTAHATELAEAVCDAGADALLAVTPYYNKTNDRGILLHYRALADAASRPLILYNVPSRTGFAMTSEHYRELAAHPNIVAVKEASGDLGLLETLCAECGDRLDIYTGNDHQLIPAAKLGASGLISVYSNLLPRGMTEIWRLLSAGDYRLAGQRMRSILPQIQALFREVNPIPVKYAASLKGLCQAEYRLPLCPPTPDTAHRLQSLFG
ncbi:MAG: 4-hydroxy-tetrahydrodipicolinate synthase [Clostridia bacterium]|nr:4-hydroxy-tetrahydrodipicolinate synthase [Clostridia bacterium]